MSETQDQAEVQQPAAAAEAAPPAPPTQRIGAQARLPGTPMLQLRSFFDQSKGTLTFAFLPRDTEAHDLEDAVAKLTYQNVSVAFTDIIGVVQHVGMSLGMWSHDHGVRSVMAALQQQQEDLKKAAEHEAELKAKADAEAELKAKAEAEAAASATPTEDAAPSSTEPAAEVQQPAEPTSVPETLTVEPTPAAVGDSVPPATN